MSNTPDPRAAKGGDDELAGTVLMSGDRVVWAGHSAVLGQQQPSEDDIDVFEGDGDETVATGELYTPPAGECAGRR